MLRQLSNRIPPYPRQYWLMFWGLLLSTAGASMIWPFLMIYVSKRLDLPLAQVATLMTINAVSSVAASFVAGFIADRLGRKGVMLVSLFAESGLFIALAWAKTYPEFALLMALRGFANPLYRVGADAMLADLIPQEQRAEAYSLIRMINNAGIAIGPIAGGMLAAQSYNLAFYVAAAGMALYGLLLTFFARETLARDWKRHEERITSSLRWAYVQVLTDLRFMPFISLVMFGWVTATLMWIIMPKYAYDNFGITENVYGPIPATNALMVVFLQMFVTMFTRRHRPLSMIALGMFLYALANGLVALSSGFWGFWLAMVVMTLGELVIVPTASTHTANIAPADMRGRYMSIFGLTWSFGQGVGPVLGGLLNDHFGPRAIWVGGMLIGLVSAFGLFLLSRRADAPHTASRLDALPSFTANPREPEGR